MTRAAARGGACGGRRSATTRDRPCRPWPPRLSRDRGRQPALKPRIDPPRIGFENLSALGLADRRLVDIPLGIVETEAGLWIVALDGADHLGSEQDIVDRHDAGEEIDTGLMIDAGIEEDIVTHDLGQF